MTGPAVAGHQEKRWLVLRLALVPVHVLVDQPLPVGMVQGFTDRGHKFRRLGERLAGFLDLVRQVASPNVLGLATLLTTATGRRPG